MINFAPTKPSDISKYPYPLTQVPPYIADVVRFVEAGDYTFCCSEGWATGIFVSTPPLTCSESTLAEDVEALQVRACVRAACVRACVWVGACGWV